MERNERQRWKVLPLRGFSLIERREREGGKRGTKREVSGFCGLSGFSGFRASHSTRHFDVESQFMAARSEN